MNKNWLFFFLSFAVFQFHQKLSSAAAPEQETTATWASSPSTLLSSAMLSNRLLSEFEKEQAIKLLQLSSYSSFKESLSAGNDSVPVFYVSCQKFVEMFAEVAKNFTNCVVLHSIPPRVCIDCVEQYLLLQDVYHQLQQSDEEIVMFGKTCYDVIFSSYMISYVEKIFKLLKSGIWDTSQCDYCWTFGKGNSSSSRNLTDHVEKFWRKHDSLQECIRNETSVLRLLHCPNSTNDTICEHCWRKYDELYSYYWDIFIKPDVNFCIDVETTMNDTIEEWRQCYKCSLPAVKSKWHQTFLVCFLTALITVATILFYVGSFIQGEKKARNLKKYSKLREQRRSTDPDYLVDDSRELNSGNADPGYGAIG